MTYERIFPPKEIFLNPEGASWDWEIKGTADNAVLEFPSQGMLYWTKGKKGYLPFKGFPFPPALDAVAFFKRAIIQKLRFPLFWKRELEELGNVSIHRYFLKPERYSRPCREIYRLISPFSEWWAHATASIFEWDVAYRYRVQLYFSRVSPRELKKNPKKTINDMLDFAERTDENRKVKEKYRQMGLAFNVLWYLPKFRGIIKVVVKEIRFEEFAMDEADIKLAFVK